MRDPTSENANVKRLADKGAKVFVGRASNLGEAAVVVVSTAIKRDNPELIAARESACRSCAAPKCSPN